MIYGITGHRPNKLGGYREPNAIQTEVLFRIDTTLMRLKPERMIIGMAQGVDQWAAELCIFNDIPFIAAVPCINQESIWPPHAQARYRAILEMAESVVHVTRGTYNSGVMQARNRWIVDRCDRLIAVWDGKAGKSGTAHCVGYAISHGIPVERIDVSDIAHEPRQSWRDLSVEHEDFEGGRRRRHVGVVIPVERETVPSAEIILRAAPAPIVPPRPPREPVEREVGVYTRFVDLDD